MGALATMVRWVRIRGLKEGKIQKGRVEGAENDARDDAQRPQDYGFAAMPVDGEGLKIEVGGHTIILRADRTAERPQLADYEVAVWHKEGHMVKLKAGRIIELQGDKLIANLGASVEFNAPSMVFNGQSLAFNMTGSTTMTSAGAMDIAAASLKHNGKDIGETHAHINVQPGAGTSGPPA